MYDAFISYSRENLSIVQSLKKELDDRRLRVFVDLDSLRAGQEWPPQLGAALRNSRMMVLCWSAKAEASRWVDAEINDCLITRTPVLPWLLDSTPLPPKLSQTHGIKGTDPAPVVNAVAHERQRHYRRRAVTLAAAAVLVPSAAWFGWRRYTDRSVTFRGHVVDELGNPVAGVAVEADGERDETGVAGDFRLVLPGPPGRGLRVTVRKVGFVSREINTQSDVPDLGVVLEKER